MVDLFKVFCEGGSIWFMLGFVAALILLFAITDLPQWYNQWVDKRARKRVEQRKKEYEWLKAYFECSEVIK